MNLKSTGTFAAAGIALIVVVNAIVLLGVRYNRALPADSTLQLSERELSSSMNWSVAREDSGLNLSLQVRIPTSEVECEAPCDSEIWSGAARWGSPYWLDNAKLRALGFPAAPADGAAGQGRGDDHLLPKDVYVVLEFDGASYQRQVARSVRAAEQDEQRAQAAPDNKQLAERARYSRKNVSYVRERESRLFCIDAGLDPAALRKTYADRSHFAIVRGTIGVSSYRHGDKSERVGTFLGVRIDELNVPLAYRAVFGNAAALPRVYLGGASVALENDTRNTGPRYDVSVAWGRRLEPWIRSAAAHQP